MLLGYGSYSVSWAIGGSAGGAAFIAPADGSALTDGRTGSVQTCQWIGGTQNTGSYVELTGTITSTLDATAAHGVVGVINVIGLPVGTKLVIAGVTQRLVRTYRGTVIELGAWALPFATGNTIIIRIYNDVNGVASIAANAQFALGEIFVGRVMTLDTQISGNPQRQLVDPTASQVTSGGQHYELMRKPYWQVQAQLGRVSTKDAMGGSESSIVSGSNPSGVIDLRTLYAMLSTARLCAVCDVQAANLNEATTTNGITFDKDFMQMNWMLARPSNLGQLAYDTPPRWSWNPTFAEAT